MKNRCLILVSNLAKKTDRFVSDVCDAIVDIGIVPLLPVDVNDIKSPDTNMSEMMMESDIVTVIYKDDDEDHTSDRRSTEDEILEIISDAESIGKSIVFIDLDREYESLGEYIKKAFEYYEM